MTAGGQMSKATPRAAAAKFADFASMEAEGKGQKAEGGT